MRKDKMKVTSLFHYTTNFGNETVFFFFRRIRTMTITTTIIIKMRTNPIGTNMYKYNNNLLLLESDDGGGDIQSESASN